MEKTPFVKIYVADIAPLKNSELYSRAYGMVREERRIRTDRYRFDKDKYLCVGAECLLIHALNELGTDYKSLVIKDDVNGKPYIEASPVRFNLSHSKERVMCIVSDAPAGCDVESIGKADMEIAERFFTKEEYAMLQSCRKEEERQDLFYRIWTLKESFIKCVGLGLKLPLDSFGICFADGRARISMEKTTEKLPQSLAESICTSTYHMYEADLSDGYKYSWCLKDAEGEGKLNVVSLADIP